MSSTIPKAVKANQIQIWSNITVTIIDQLIQNQIAKKQTFTMKWVLTETILVGRRLLTV